MFSILLQGIVHICSIYITTVLYAETIYRITKHRIKERVKKHQTLTSTTKLREYLDNQPSIIRRIFWIFT